MNQEGSSPVWQPCSPCATPRPSLKTASRPAQRENAPFQRQTEGRDTSAALPTPAFARESGQTRPTTASGLPREEEEEVSARHSGPNGDPEIPEVHRAPAAERALLQSGSGGVPDLQQAAPEVAGHGPAGFTGGFRGLPGASLF